MDNRVFYWGTTQILRAEDREGRYLVCFPCGLSFTFTAQCVHHVSTCHILEGETIPLGWEESITTEEGWLREHKSKGIA